MIYAWHGPAFDSPFVTISSTHRVSLIVDIDYVRFDNDYRYHLEGVRLLNDNNSHLYVPRAFVKEIFEHDLDELEEWMRSKHREDALEQGLDS